MFAQHSKQQRLITCDGNHVVPKGQAHEVERARREPHFPGQYMLFLKGTSAIQQSSPVEGPADLLEKSEIQAFMGNLLMKC